MIICLVSIIHVIFWIEKNTPEAYLLYNLGWAVLYLGHADPFVLILHCWGALSGCTIEQTKRSIFRYVIFPRLLPFQNGIKRHACVLKGKGSRGAVKSL